MEVPAHALLECVDLRIRRARNHGERHIAMRQVNGHSVEVIGEIRTARAALRPSGTEHEVVDDELAAAVEQIGELLFAARPFEHILSSQLLPRGSSRRCRLSSSRRRVNSFSFARNCFRASIHSPCDTVFGSLRLLLLLSSPCSTSFCFSSGEDAFRFLRFKNTPATSAVRPPVPVADRRNHCRSRKTEWAHRILPISRTRSHAALLLHEERRLVGARSPACRHRHIQHAQVHAELPAMLVPVAEHHVAKEQPTRLRQPPCSPATLAATFRSSPRRQTCGRICAHRRDALVKVLQTLVASLQVAEMSANSGASAGLVCAQRMTPPGTDAR